MAKLVRVRSQENIRNNREGYDENEALLIIPDHGDATEIIKACLAHISNPRVAGVYLLNDPDIETKVIQYRPYLGVLDNE